MASGHEHGTFSRDLTVLPAHPGLSANGMNHTCLCLPRWGNFKIREKEKGNIYFGLLFRLVC